MRMKFVAFQAFDVCWASPNGQWTFCGHPGIEDATPEETPTTGHKTGKADNATALTVYQGRLFSHQHMVLLTISAASR